MRSAVVLGGGLPQTPLIERLRARGLRVAVVDGRDDRPAIRLADVHVHQDFSDVEATVAALERHGVDPDCIVSMATDRAVAPVARLCAIYGLPGLPVAAARCASDKILQRSAFAAAGVPSARFASVATLAEARAAYEEIGPTAVVKPADGSAQRGVSEVRSAADLEAAVAHAAHVSRSGELVVEEFLDGDEYTVNGFVAGGRFTTVTVTARVLAPAPAVGVCLAHRYPCGRSATETGELARVAAWAAAAVGIDDAPVYAQLRFGTRGARMIEIGARLGGGGDATLAEIVTGIDLVEAVIDVGLGRTPRLERDSTAASCGQVAFIVPSAPGRVVRAGAGTAANLPGVHEIGFYHPPGTVVPPLQSASGRIGFAIVSASSPAELDARTEAVFAAVDVSVDGSGEGAASAPASATAAQENGSSNSAL